MHLNEFRPAWQDGPGTTLQSLWHFMGWPVERKKCKRCEELAKKPHDSPSQDTIETLPSWQCKDCEQLVPGTLVEGAVLRCPEWPPDLFALAASALRKSGAYTVPIDAIVRAFPKDTASIAQKWRKALVAAIEGGGRATVPDEVQTQWKVVAQERTLGLPLFRLRDRRDVAAALVVLLGIADETCSGVGLPINADPPRDPASPVADNSKDEASKRTSFHECADQLLFPSQFGSTLCRYVHPSAGRVLPKTHTAQCGVTIRSFSHHLAFCETDEVQPSWLSVPGARGDVENVHHFNVLIAPWPEVVRPAQVKPIGPIRQDSKEYFCFNFKVSESHLEIAPKLLALADAAEKLVGSLDAVVMPELALSTYDYRAARSALLRRGIFFISGVGSRRRENRLNVDVPLSKHHAVHLRQRKHHRWKLDESQIRQYGLGARLNPAKVYWEQIGVEERKLMFVVLRRWLVTTALICEDLARHDPVGELIRSIGPNLVVALLMDGPQLTSRWASRYATGLADDPGSSVLSVTSLGMAELSRPPDLKEPRSRVVALWKDAFCGTPVELRLPEGAHGLVITLAVKYGTEATADLRTERDMASFPTLAGVHSVTVPKEIPTLVHDDTRGRWISPYDAFLLAQLAQRSGLSPDIAPSELDELHGVAYRIGREVWRFKTDGPPPSPDDDDKVAEPATWQERETAEAIYRWHETNRPLPGDGSKAVAETLPVPPPASPPVAEFKPAS